ncbi:MAG TPA: cellulase family glycosylhydrolase [Candidatus Solibacter sp.]|jgi:endoglycosylceramidase|nr:cellulase family glycosylhydrolase [Candidatus Solibacter sp.]
MDGHWLGESRIAHRISSGLAAASGVPAATLALAMRLSPATTLALAMRLARAPRLALATTIALMLGAPVVQAAGRSQNDDRIPYQLNYLAVGPAAGPAGLPQVTDAAGRTVLLRGVNVNGLEDYWQNSPTPLAVPYPISTSAYTGDQCPARNTAVESMAVCWFDAPQMRALGYDSVRLAVSWSLLEPQPGQVDTAYIDRIAQVVAWFKAAGMYTIIDMHQDAWSKYIYSSTGEVCPPPFQSVGGSREADGAPAWASARVTPACALLGVRELDAAVQEDFQRFWSDVAAPDGVGLQEHYASVVLALASRFHGDPSVAGYELMNEPSPGFAAPEVMDQVELFPFYSKVIRTVTGAVAGFRQLVFIEPDITRDITDQSNILVPWSVFSSYPNVVYAPHVYTRVFTPDANLNAAAGTPFFFPLNGGYDSAVRDAKSLGLPLWVGEFGNGVPDDESILRAHYGYADAYGIGSSLWVWKADQSSGFSVYHGPFGVGSPFPSRVKFTSRVYPMFTAGQLRSLNYNPDTGAFQVDGTSPRVQCGDRTRATVLFVPAVSQGVVTAQGAAVETVAVPSGRIAFAYPRGGEYRVTLGGSAEPAGCGNRRADVTAAGTMGASFAAGSGGLPNTAAEQGSAVAAGQANAAMAAQLSADVAAKPGAVVAVIAGLLGLLVLGFRTLRAFCRRAALMGL